MSGTLFGSLKFESYQLNDRKEVLTSVDSTGKYLIKIQLIRNPKKSQDIAGEFEVMKLLNSKGSQTCPIAYEFSTLDPSEVCNFQLDGSENLQYIIQEYVPSDSGYGLADVLLTLIEQKKLGVYQGDVKPSNVRFNSQTGVCIFIDYDQSEILTDDQRSMSNFEFLSYCNEHDKRRYGFGNWLRHYQGLSNVQVQSFLENGALNLAQTCIFRMQKTTNSASGIYHTIDSKDVFALGSRGLDRRAELLNEVEFKQGEKVLDIGCNAGLLCEYLHDRGCKVTGVDNDPHIVIGAKIVSNILGRDIDYSCMDLDYVDEIEQFDTVMLFSVLHHTRNPPRNAKKLTNSCKRVIIETRLIENGKQPIEGQWIDTTKWSFEDLNGLIGLLEEMFEGFKFTRNLGFADKGRYILEFNKQ